MVEFFVYELYKFCVFVIDFKVIDYIWIIIDGDFVLSWDYLELSSSLFIEYVLIGIMVKY